MRDYSRKASEMKGQIGRYSQRISQGFSKPRRKWTAQMLYGILASQEAVVSQIGRALKEPVKLKKVHDRLCRHLQDEGIGQALQQNYLKKVASWIKASTIIAVDISEVSKEHARGMEKMSWVRDGSTGEIKQGYWLCEAVAVEEKKKEILPLYRSLYSSEAEDFVSENAQLFSCIDKLTKAFDGRGIYVIDRGGDRGELYHYLLERSLSFVIRQKGDRLIITKQGMKARRVRDVEVAWRYFTCLKAKRKGRGKTYHLQLGCRKVFLPQREQALSLVVVKGFGHKPLMLLTTIERPMAEQLMSILNIYLCRWSIEEVLRHEKVQWHLEAIQLRKYASWQNMVILVHLANAFICLTHRHRFRLKAMWERLLKEAQRLHPKIPSFPYYCLASGLKHLLRRSRGWSYRPPQRPDKQLCLFNLELLEGLL